MITEISCETAQQCQQIAAQTQETALLMNLGVVAAVTAPFIFFGVVWLFSTITGALRRHITNTTP